MIISAICCGSDRNIRPKLFFVLVQKRGWDNVICTNKWASIILLYGREITQNVSPRKRKPTRSYLVKVLATSFQVISYRNCTQHDEKNVLCGMTFLRFLKNKHDILKLIFLLKCLTFFSLVFIEGSAMEVPMALI
jgi:hypothetical protein